MHEEYGLKSNSAEMQDIAAALLLGSNKKFLDIGASSAVLGNNTYLLEKELGWDGLCFDLREEGDRVTATTFTNQGGTYEERGTKLHNVDCTTPLLNEETEVYESGSEDLWTQPFSKEGIDARKYKAKDILRNKGYLLLFEDVSFETGGGLHPMEDWWINPQYFPEWVRRIQGQGLHFSECIKRLSIISSQLHSEEVAQLIQKTCFK
jgi:hypothetical protein